MKTAKATGDVLESALQLIEECILRNDPGLANRTTRITPKKVIRDKGVRHEIDLWVEIDGEAGYDSLFIFECKNWSKKVSKNEILVFGAKIESSGAQRGFFVARSFTLDAAQQAKQFSRMEIKTVKEIPSLELPTAVSKLHGIRDFDVQAKVEFRKKHPSPSVFPSLQGVEIVLNGRLITFDRFTSDLVSDVYSSAIKVYSSAEFETGTYPYSFSGRRDYAEGELLIAGEEMTTVEVSATAKLEIARAAILSSFEVDGRGRAYSCKIDFRDGSGVDLDIGQTMEMYRREQEAGGGYMRLLIRRVMPNA